MLCRSNFEWFDIVREGDMERIVQMAPRHARQYEYRETDMESGVYQGFCAIHYAVLRKDINAYAVLARYEAECRTTEVVEFENPFHAGSFVSLARGSNCLQLALLLGAEEIASHIAEQLLANIPAYENYLRQNANGFNIYTTCLTVPPAGVALRVLESAAIFDRVIMQDYQPHVTIPRLVTFFNQPEHQGLFMHFYEDGRYRPAMVEQILMRTKNGTLYDVAKATHCWWMINVILDSLEWSTQHGRPELVDGFLDGHDIGDVLAVEPGRQIDAF